MAGGSGRGWFEADDLRDVLPIFSLAFGLVAVITQPSSAGDLVLVALPIAAFGLWAVAPRVPLAAVSAGSVVPVVLAQRTGQLEPVMFNAALLAFAAARWSRSLAAAVSLGVLAAATPLLVALAPGSDGGRRRHLGRCHRLRLGRRSRGGAPGRLVGELEGARQQLAQQALLAERRRIARDVHDFVGHGLAAVMLQVTSARHVLRRDADAAEEALRCGLLHRGASMPARADDFGGSAPSEMEQGTDPLRGGKP